MFYGNRQVRTRLLGGVGAGGEKPPATRLCGNIYNINMLLVVYSISIKAKVIRCLYAEAI